VQLLNPNLEKKKKLHTALTKLLADPKELQMGVFGSKDDNEDEEYYPYALATINIP